MKTTKRFIVVGRFEFVQYEVGPFDNLQPTPFWALPGGGISTQVDLEAICANNGWKWYIRQADQ